jgi:hypothetical protein
MRPMTAAEIEAVASADPDARPMTADELAVDLEAKAAELDGKKSRRARVSMLCRCPYFGKPLFHFPDHLLQKCRQPSIRRQLEQTAKTREHLPQPLLLVIHATPPEERTSTVRRSSQCVGFRPYLSRIQ